MREHIKYLLKEKERHLLAGTLLVGFFVDTLTLTRIDLWFDNLILIGYLTIATFSIGILNISHKKQLKKYTTYLLQYAFGGLFSGFIIFYSQSAGFLGSWLFVFIFIALFIGTEFFKEQYSKRTYQSIILFIALLSYTTFLTPILLGKMGAGVFLLSGVISIIFFIIIISLIKKLSRKASYSHSIGFPIAIAVIYVVFNTLYFTNIIPPIPLSLQELTVAHSVKRNDAGQFLVAVEKRPWYQYFNTSDITYKPNEELYVFTSVFAPTKIHTNISHQWSYFNKNKREWERVSRIRFPIAGGREEGFRGYTFKRVLREGRWRVDVLTDRGQILGRKTFTITFASSTPPLVVERK